MRELIWLLVPVSALVALVGTLLFVPIRLELVYERHDDQGDSVKAALRLPGRVKLRLSGAALREPHEVKPPGLRTRVEGEGPGFPDHTLARETWTSGDLRELIELPRSFERNVRAGVRILTLLLRSERSAVRGTGGPLLGVGFAPFLAVARRCERFEWSTTIGAGDAYVTALASGAMWSVIGALLPLLRRRFRLMKKPVLRVNPDFKRPGFHLELSCIFRFNLGQIMLVSVRRILRTQARRGWCKWLRTAAHIPFKA